MSIKSNRGLNSAGGGAAPVSIQEPYHLAGHPDASLSGKDIQMLVDLAHSFRVASAGTEGMFTQRFEYVIPVGDTTSKSFTSTVHSFAVEGGYVKISNAEGDYDIDIGIVDDTDGLCVDVIEELVNSPDGYNGYAPTLLEFLTGAKDVTITITTNAALTNTKPIRVEIFLICSAARATS